MTFRRRPLLRSRSQRRAKAHADYLKRRRQQWQAKRAWAQMIGCPFCEEIVPRSEFIEHENAHRIENPQLYEWIDSKFPDWKP